MATTCPTCGQPCHSRRLLIDASGLVRHGGRDLKIPRGHVMQLLRALNDAYPDSLTFAELLDVIHGHDPNGGPLTALNCLWVKIARLRRDLSPAGIEIRSVFGAYRLEFVSETEKAA